MVKYLNKDHVYFNILSKKLKKYALPKEKFYNCPEIYNDFFDKTGYPLYLVGGAVRDTIMNGSKRSNVAIHDFDFASACPASIILEAYPDAKLVGESFEVVLLPYDGQQYEIARFRSETNHNGRGCDCSFEGVTLAADLNRRDLTMNAIAYNPYLKITYDPHNGIDDIENGIIRFVGNALERIQEDNLRIFRAIRFKYTYNAAYSIDTYHSILSCMDLLNTLPKERIYAELTKLSQSVDFVHTSNNDNNLDLVSMFSVIFGKSFSDMIGYNQNSKYHDFTLDEHSLEVYKNLYTPHLSNRHKLKIAGLLHDIGKPLVATVNPKTGYTNYIGHGKASAAIVRELLTNLKFPKAEVNQICELIEFHDMVHYSDLTEANKMILDYKLKFNDLDELLLLQYADATSKKKGTPVSRVKLHTTMRIHSYKDLGKLILPGEHSNEEDALFTIETLIKFNINKTKLKEALDELVIWCIKKVVTGENESDYKRLKPSEYKNRLKVLAIKYK